MSALDDLADLYHVNFCGAQRVFPEPLHTRPDPYRADMLIGTALEETVVDPRAAPRRRGPYLAPPPAAQDAAGTPPPVAEVDADDAETPQAPVLAAEDAKMDAPVCTGPTPTPALETTATAEEAQDADFADLDDQDAHPDAPAAVDADAPPLPA